MNIELNVEKTNIPKSETIIAAFGVYITFAFFYSLAINS